MPRPQVVLVAVLACAAFVVGLTGGGDDGRDARGGADRPAARPAPDRADGATDTTAGPREADRAGRRERRRDGAPRVPAAARALARSLPERRAVAQLFVVGFEGTTASAGIFRRLLDRDWGALVVQERNVVDPFQLGALAGEAGVVARNAGNVPPLVMAAPSLPGRIGLPPAARLRAVRPAVARGRARAAGERLRAAGVHLALGPLADVAAAGSPAVAVALGDDPERVGALARALAQGLGAAGVGAAVGTFPGEGAIAGDPVLGGSVGLSRAQLSARDLRAFRAVLPVADVVVISSATYVAFDAVTPAALQPAVVRGLLRRELRYRGVAMTSDLAGLTAAGRTPGAAAVEALRAGVDLLYLPGGPREQEAAYRAVLAALDRGDLPRARVREALLRVLTLKHRLGVLPQPAP